MYEYSTKIFIVFFYAPMANNHTGMPAVPLLTPTALFRKAKLQRVIPPAGITCPFNDIPLKQVFAAEGGTPAIPI
jgi:hypothetical protein